MIYGPAIQQTDIFIFSAKLTGGDVQMISDDLKVRIPTTFCDWKRGLRKTPAEAPAPRVLTAALWAVFGGREPLLCLTARARQIARTGWTGRGFRQFA